MSHLQNNSKNSNYTRVFCNYYGHHLVVICKLLPRSWFGLTIKDVAPHWEEPKTGCGSDSFFPGNVETTSRHSQFVSVLSADTHSGVYLQFWKQRNGFRREIRACSASINGHPVEDYSINFPVSSREAVNNHSEPDCLTVCWAGWRMQWCLLWISHFYWSKTTV